MSSLFENKTDTPNYYRKDGPSAPVAWYGGKAYYAKWIIERFPVHRVYVEPFGGAANILLRKHPSEVEIYNDLDSRIVNLFKVIRNPDLFAQFEQQVSLTPYSREQFAELADQPEPTEPVERAWWFFVRARQAVGGIGMSKISPGSWAVSTRTRRKMAEPVSKYLSAVDGLEDVADRLRTVVFESLEALTLIPKYDGGDVLFYCDPPYLPETRHGGQAKTYGQEMSFEDHEQLLEVLIKCDGKVMLSGYRSDLYDTLLAGWTLHEVTGKAHMANSGQVRTEALWLNG